MVEWGVQNAGKVSELSRRWRRAANQVKRATQANFGETVKLVILKKAQDNLSLLFSHPPAARYWKIIVVLSLYSPLSVGLSIRLPCLLASPERPLRRLNLPLALLKVGHGIARAVGAEGSRSGSEGCPDVPAAIDANARVGLLTDCLGLLQREFVLAKWGSWGSWGAWKGGESEKVDKEVNEGRGPPSLHSV